MKRIENDLKMFFALEQYFDINENIENLNFNDINLKNYKILSDRLKCLSIEEIDFLRKHYNKKISKKEMMANYKLNENKYYSKIRRIIRKIYNNMNELSKI